MPLTTNTIIVGAGHAGLALSYFLTARGHEHAVLERGRVGQAWRERWDSLTLLTPNWLNRLPGSPRHEDPQGFLDRRAFLAYLSDYARSFGAPVVERTAVRSAEPHEDGFRVATDAGTWYARNLVLATGECGTPIAPPQLPAGVTSLHAAHYRNASALPPGRVLVVGAGASGQQIAAELRRAGRDVVLAAGRHSRAPRSYRGRDIWYWLQLLGDLDRTVDELPDLEAARRVPGFPLSGAGGGEDLDLNVLDALGVVVVGRLVNFDGRSARFADDLRQTTGEADARLAKLLRRIDAHPLASGADPDPPRPIRLRAAPRAVDLTTLGAVVWATGYRPSYPWLHVPGVLDEQGRPLQRRGVTGVRGLYVVGLAFQHRRKSHFIGGVGADARHVAGELAPRAARSRRGTLRPALAQ